MLVDAHNNNDPLLERVAIGDEKAFRLLFDKYWNSIYSIAFRFTKSKVMASEIVQDVFLKIWNRREKLAQIRNFDNYLFIIARNHIYNNLRQSPLQFLPIEEAVAPVLPPDSNLFFKETSQIVARAIEQLPGQQRIIFDMSRRDGLNYATIAERLNLSRLTVKTHMHKALQSIKAYLNQHSSSLIFFFLLRLLSGIMG